MAENNPVTDELKPTEAVDDDSFEKSTRLVKCI